MRHFFTKEFVKCSAYNRHKDTLIPPDLLKAKYSLLEQRQGDFVVTTYGCYHQGFNSGFNVAKAINFALDKEWFTEFGRDASYCSPRLQEIKDIKFSNSF